MRSLEAVRLLGRDLARSWARTGRANGYLYQLVNSYGHLLADSEELETRLPNGCVARCDLRDHVQRNLWLAGVYEPVEGFLFTRLLRPGMVVIDGGANIGQYTLLATTAVGMEGEVHSFEPLPVNFDRLSRHVLLNGIRNVTLNQAALWREERVLSFELPKTCSNNNGAYRASTTVDSGTTHAVQALTLDRYFDRRQLRSVDVIKLDVEGSESSVLLGARRVLRELRPYILMEINRSALTAAGSSLEELWSIVTDLGYHAWLIGPSAAKSGRLDSFSELNQSNVILHVNVLPVEIQFGWTEKTCLAWARSQW
jgi:FkbM family methyltransferase